LRWKGVEIEGYFLHPCRRLAARGINHGRDFRWIDDHTPACSSHPVRSMSRRTLSNLDWSGRQWPVMPGHRRATPPSPTLDDTIYLPRRLGLPLSSARRRAPPLLRVSHRPVARGATRGQARNLATRSRWNNSTRGPCPCDLSDSVQVNFSLIHGQRKRPWKGQSALPDQTGKSVTIAVGLHELACEMARVGTAGNIPSASPD